MACTAAQRFFAFTMPTYHPEFARLLEQHLNRQDRTAAWLAKRLGVSPSTVSRWLDGSTRPDSPETLARVADVLGVHARQARDALFAAAGYAAGRPSADAESADHRPLLEAAPIARSHGWRGVLRRTPAWAAAPLLDRPAIYAELGWKSSSIDFASDCGDAPFDLAQQRLLVSSAFGAYFAGLLERSDGYIELNGQVDAPAPVALHALAPLARMEWALNEPLGPRVVVIAADAGMGKSTLAAQVVRCLLHRQAFDVLLGDSAKQRRVDPVTGQIVALPEQFDDVASLLRRLREQLGLPTPAHAHNLSDILDRLTGRRALIVIDNLETISERAALFTTLAPFLGRDHRAIITTRQVDALPALSLRSMVVHLRTLASAVALTTFLRWHVIHFSAEHPAMRTANLEFPDGAAQKLLACTGGAPLLVQLVFSAVVRSSWAYLDHLPRLYGDALLNFLYAERWAELARLDTPGRLARELLTWVAAEQVQGRRVDVARLRTWAERRQSVGELGDVLRLLYERFLLVNHDRTHGNFTVFPSLAEFLLREVAPLSTTVQGNEF